MMNIKTITDKYVKSPRFSNLSESSQYSYDYALRVLAKHFGDRDIATIRRSDFIALQSIMKPGVANLTCRVASVLFEYAVDLDILPFNPAAQIKKLKGGSRIKWNPEEVTSAITQSDRVVSVAVALAWYTGQRESDILRMRWRDIEGEYIRTIQGKTKLEMKIKLHPDIIEYLARMRGDAKPDDFIVSGKKAMSTAAFRGRFRRKMDRIDISKTFHGVRKGVASSIAEKGASTKEIAAMLGHKTLSMAAYYSEQASNTILTESAVDQLVSCISAQASR